MGAKVSRRRILLLPLLLVTGGGLGRLYGNQGAQRIHVVVSGDTLSGIAVAYGTTVSALKQENGLTGDLIRIGDRLRIPQEVAGDILAKVKAVTEPLQGGFRSWRYIVGHHSATNSGNAEIFDRYHRGNGMENGLAYHFVIGNGTKSKDGEIEIGPRWPRQIQGGHVRSREVNRTGVGICLVGNFENGPPTPKQMQSYYSLLGYLGAILPGKLRYRVHREIDGRNHTLCPGKHFPIGQMHQRFPDKW
ncbi:MAG: LysM peptidoglycan-binding domain-containing protein [Puniceicoccaceae bacterium]